MEHFYEKIVGWFTWPRFYKMMIDKLPSGSKVVEVGTYEGKSFAYFMVEMTNAGKEFEVWGVDSFTFTGENGKSILENFLRHLEPFFGKFDTLIANSWDAASHFEDKSLDFVFLDADHVYESISKDIEAWLPKIKPGGILAGHDYVPIHPGVIQAVDENFPGGLNKEYLDEWVWYININ